MNVKLVSLICVTLIGIVGCQTTPIEEPQLDSEAITQARDLGVALGVSKYCFMVPEQYTAQESADNSMSLHYRLGLLINKYGASETLVDVANKASKDKMIELVSPQEGSHKGYQQAIEMCKDWRPHFIQSNHVYQMHLENQQKEHEINKARASSPAINSSGSSSSKSNTVQCYRFGDLSRKIETFQGSFCPLGWSNF